MLSPSTQLLRVAAAAFVTFLCSAGSASSQNDSRSVGYLFCPENRRCIAFGDIFKAGAQREEFTWKAKSDLITVVGCGGGGGGGGGAGDSVQEGYAGGGGGAGAPVVTLVIPTKKDMEITIIIGEGGDGGEGGKNPPGAQLAGKPGRNGTPSIIDTSEMLFILPGGAGGQGGKPGKHQEAGVGGIGGRDIAKDANEPTGDTPSTAFLVAAGGTGGVARNKGFFGERSAYRPTGGQGGHSQKGGGGGGGGSALGYGGQGGEGRNVFDLKQFSGVEGNQCSGGGGGAGGFRSVGGNGGKGGRGLVYIFW